ncbi:MAG: tetratricopeptide repeat protein [Muribaculaceae bacterium]
MKFLRYITIFIVFLLPFAGKSQINTEQVLRVGQNALYFEDYMLSIQYFNQVIQAKPYLAQPYFFRAIAKLNLEDYAGAKEDATLAIERNPFITDAYEVRGVALQNMGKLEEAVADYDKALSLLPENKGILFNKALAEEELKNYDTAQECYSQLLKAHPRFDSGYIGRARLYLAQGDTISALADLDKAIELNKNAINAYVIRADISIKREKDYERALEDMNEAIKLQPHYAGFFINRAFLRYNLDDYFGAMADYDYAISLDPTNVVAYFNRGLLLAEVHGNDRAIQDFTKVLQLNTDDYRALLNRSRLYEETGNYNLAIEDLNKVIERFPDFYGLYFSRMEIYEKMGDRKNAEKDYNKAMALSKRIDEIAEKGREKAHNDSIETERQERENDIPEELVTKRFSTLLTIENEHNVDEVYNNKSIRGKVQDRNVNIKLCPIFMLSYYATTNQLKETPYYIKEVDDVNSTRLLRQVLQVTDEDSPITDEEIIQQHFASIEYYNSYIATHTPRAIDYFARAMDFMTIRNYKNAIEDFTRAIELTPDFVPAYFMRAIAKNKLAILERDQAPTEANSPEEFTPANAKLQAELREIISDYDKVIELSPQMAFAYYNKGVVLAEAGDNTSALSLFSTAISLKPDFGEAYYNRGFIYMQLGQRQKGSDDLSKAGELGVIPSYNLMKRMTR